MLLWLLVSALAPGTRVYAQTTDSVPQRAPYPYHSPMAMTLTRTLPLLAVSGIYNLHNQSVAEARRSVFSSFHNRYDDYLQFAPLVAQIGMHAFGVEGRSRSTGELLTADALSAAIMMSVVTATKTLTQVERPDGSARNSFPSGHTAMAFASATMLHMEYDARYPWLSAIGYLGAAGVGIGRMLNNRHWIGDVAVGSLVGTLSVELGYWLSDRLWRRGATYQQHSATAVGPRRGFSFSLPGYIGWGTRTESRQVGLGMRWRYSDHGYFAWASILLDRTEVTSSTTTAGATTPHAYDHHSLTQLGWGREWSLGPRWLTLDTSVAYGLMHGGYIHQLSLIASPRIYLSPSTSIRLDARYTLSSRPGLSGTTAGATYDGRRPAFMLGSALELSL